MDHVEEQLDNGMGEVEVGSHGETIWYACCLHCMITLGGGWSEGLVAEAQAIEHVKKTGHNVIVGMLIKGIDSMAEMAGINDG